jgi:hypothetical protein
MASGVAASEAGCWWRARALAGDAAPSADRAHPWNAGSDTTAGHLEATGSPSPGCRVISGTGPLDRSRARYRAAR